MSDAPAGWYPDPAAAGVFPPPLRYWDGHQWTEHRSEPAAPPTYGQPPGPTTPDGAPLAGWWHRVGATLLDSLFGVIVSIIFTLPAQISIQSSMTRLQNELQRRLDANESGTFSWYVHQVADLYRGHLWEYAVPLVIILIGQTCFLHLLGGTPGQLLTKLRVRRRDAAGPIGWGRAFIRVLIAQFLGSLLVIIAMMSGSVGLLLVCYPLVVIWQLLDPLWAAWDGNRQTLHDKIVGTNVVRNR